MPKLQKKRSSTPCLGICSTTFGDEVCKGCKRFAHEIVSWTKYSPEEREIINLRLEKFKIKILKRRFKIIDKELFASKLDEKAINFLLAFFAGKYYSDSKGIVMCLLKLIYAFIKTIAYQ